MKTTNNYTEPKLDRNEAYWSALKKMINKRELDSLYPNGIISFAVKLQRGDKITLQLLAATGLNLKKITL